MSDKPKVLLLGDSIRMAYQPLVADLLKDEADVIGPTENCQFSEFTLMSLDKWLKEFGTPDIVHWNNGIHDVGHNPQRDPVQFPLKKYMLNLLAILTKLRSTGARIIWATSTPVHDNRPFSEHEWSWRNAEIDFYNMNATSMMRSEGIPINDLHDIINENQDAYLAEDMLHLSEEGNRLCAEAVARAIRKQMD